MSTTIPDDIDAPRRPPTLGSEPDVWFRHYFDDFEQALGSHANQWREKAGHLRVWGQAWVLDGWLKPDLEALLSIVTDDFVYETPALLGVECRGRDAYRQYVKDFVTAYPHTAYGACYPPFLALDGTQLILPYHWTGHFTGPLRVPGTSRTLAPTGRPFSVIAFDLHTFRGEQICRLRTIYDLTAFFQQIGLLPPSDHAAVRRLAPLLQPLLAKLMRRRSPSRGT